ncbi:MAG: tRNA (guanosine(46)-N7)-methyltransferase TrmB, partial [Akkermansiaceae bacterium]
LFQIPFLDSVVRVLKPGGELFCKMYHDDDLEWSQEHLAEYSRLEKLAWPDNAFFYPKTDFQIQWEAEGKRLQGLRAQKATS